MNETKKRKGPADPAVNAEYTLFGKTARGAEADSSASLAQDAEGISRRRFCALLSASAAFTTTAACSSPTDRGNAVPYTKTPAGVLPGKPVYYATTYREGVSAFPVLVKTREGRPIHVQANDRDPLSAQGAPFRAVADLLGLYDPERSAQPTKNGRPISWDRAERELLAALREAETKAKKVLLMSRALLSPSQEALLQHLKRAIPGLGHVTWEPLLPAAPAEAAMRAYGERLVGSPRFDKAAVVLSFHADFTATMPGASVAISQFAKGRKVKNRTDRMSRLYVVEGRMSLTGMNADHRLPLRPAATAELAFAIAGELHRQFALPLPDAVSASDLGELGSVAHKHGLDLGVLRSLVRDLAQAGSEALVVSGPEMPPELHLASLLLMEMLGVIGTTIYHTQAQNFAAPFSAEESRALVQEMMSGAYAVALFWDANPLYNHPDAAEFSTALQKIPFRVRLDVAPDETSAACQLMLAANHWLESWGDWNIGSSSVLLQQPIIRPLFDTRQAEDVLLALARELGVSAPKSYRELIRTTWREELQKDGRNFEAAWNAALHDGVFQRQSPPRPALVFNGKAVNEAAQSARSPVSSDFDLVLHADTKLFDGRLGNNGWLQELPDPVTKTVWGNPLLISPADAIALALVDGDVVTIQCGERSLEIPVLIQPGQTKQVLSLALGYGRQTGAIGAGIGVNAFPLVRNSKGLATGVSLSKTSKRQRPIRTQEHHALGDLRHIDLDLVRSMSLAQYATGSAEHTSVDLDHTLYPATPFNEHKWEMVIDLNLCVGCGACVIACQSENNIPAVGPEQVERGREMHWLRIDRYFVGSSDNPEARIQPMLCQHCDHAPCENVCPVVATTHSPDGLNQMTYNRCVGTRYCANNCPYKVRRFNFFDFNGEIQKPREMAFNPEVTVRPRGVMEKCTFCVQRITYAKWHAKAEGRPIADNEVQTACQAACPAQAISFGNARDANSNIARLRESDRGYKVLGELGTRPGVTYLTKLRNSAPQGGSNES